MEKSVDITIARFTGKSLSNQKKRILRRKKMDNLSIISKISLIATILFGYLCFRTSPDSKYETVEMEKVSTKWVFLVISIVCFGFFLASLTVWK